MNTDNPYIVNKVVKHNMAELQAHHTDCKDRKWHVGEGVEQLQVLVPPDPVPSLMILK